MSEKLIFCPDCGDCYWHWLAECPNCGSHHRVGHMEKILRQWEEEANSDSIAKRPL